MLFVFIHFILMNKVHSGSSFVTKEEKVKDVEGNIFESWMEKGNSGETEISR